MKKIIIVFSILVFNVSAYSQELSNDPVFLKNMINTVANQRNIALNTAAIYETKITALSEELSKAQERIKELEKEKK